MCVGFEQSNCHIVILWELSIILLGVLNNHGYLDMFGTNKTIDVSSNVEYEKMPFSVIDRTIFLLSLDYL